ncbi:MAG: hypothetical protein ABSA30_02670 [Candidatus Aminicenantales bacterium]|jgi:hypothetical protein
MNMFVRLRKAAIFAIGLSLILLAAPSLRAQTGADEALTKKYADLLGRYDLDLTAAGGDMHPTNVIVKDGRLWLDDGDGRPAAIQPVGDSGLEFEGQDDNSGPIKVVFIRDDSGAVVKMHLVMTDSGMDVFGKKIK